jgi:predicted unusual protein kinase regulating ubiquinone biosynthesis (AarF/ABC1/UbiB family)
MKMGQLLSMADDSVLSKPWREALSRLQSDATAKNWDEIEPILRSNLDGKWPFKQIDNQAIHAASIGQVHKATLLDGTAVAVKIRYPGLESSVRSDLENIQRVLSLANILPSKGNYDELFERVESVFMQELNFSKEMEFYQLYKSKLSSFPRFVVPDVFAEFSNDSLLVTRWIEGTNLKEWMSREGAPHVSPQVENLRNELGHSLIELLFFEIFEHGYIQSDPNPANFLVTTDGKLCLLDFGATEQLSHTLIQNYKALSRACIFGTKPEIIRVAENMNLLFKTDTEEARDSFVHMMAITCEPFAHNYFDWKDCNLTKRLKTKLLNFARSTSLRPPPAELMFLNRRILGTQLIMESLGPKVQAREIVLRSIRQQSL